MKHSNNWSKCEIFDVAPITSKLVNPKDPEFAEYYLIAPDHIASGGGRLLKLVSVKEQESISNKFFVKKGAVIYSKIRPYLQKAVIAPVDCLCSADMYPLDCCGKILPEYLLSTLLSHRFTSFANARSGRTGIPKINREEMSGFSLAIPPLPEQKAIADLLSTWDSAIEKTERLIGAKEKALRAYIQECIDDNCKRWKHLKANEIFSEFSKKNHPDAELLSVTQDRGVIPRTMLEGRVMSPDGTQETYKLVNKGDFVISLRSFQGGLEYSNYTGIISPAYTVLHPKIEIDKDFYRIFFKSYIFVQKYLAISVIGIRDGKQISIPDFMSTKLPIPPIVEQNRIALNLNQIQKELDLMNALVVKYKEQKRGLMQKLLTSEWRVKVA